MSMSFNRRCDENVLHEFLGHLQHMVRTQERLCYEQHITKWSKLSDTDFPMCVCYHFDYVPRFPFSYVDNFWCVRPVNKASSRPSEKFLNETPIELPDTVASLLEKGPNFRVPHRLNEKFLDNIDLDLEVFTYRLRWFEVMKLNPRPQQNMIPFPKNSVKLPPKMSDEKEKELTALKQEILRLARNEMAITAKKTSYRNVNKQIRQTKQFFETNNLVAVPTDKTKRLAVESTDSLILRTKQILADVETYKNITKSRQTSISKQANKIVKTFCKNLNKSDELRLLTVGCRPAHFHTFVKDHKEPEENGYPLRPIAAVNNTATEKVDWIVSRILTQLVQFVPANLKKCQRLTD